MQFTERKKSKTLEERIASWSAALLASSTVFLALLFAAAFTIANGSIWFALALGSVCIYAAQFYFLGSLGRFSASRRFLIWQLSLAGHFALFAIVWWFAGDSVVAAVFMLPEIASAALHLAGLRLAYRTLQHNPNHSP